MRINPNVEIVKRTSGVIEIIDHAVCSAFEPGTNEYEEAMALYTSLRQAYNSERQDIYDNFVKSKPRKEVSVEDIFVEISDEAVILRGTENIMKFFKEFEFEPNYRFMNTLGLKLNERGQKPAIDYIINYFNLMDNSYKNEIVAKVKSKEFKNILSDLSKATPTKTVNNRFKIYYGSAGTGKTTLAQTETENRCIVCNASMLPSDIMEDFCFEEGKPTFTPSMLWKCMNEGKPIVLDEINLLPFDTLRFLQGILDGKKKFNYKGRIVEINDGFEVIGTMNLNIGGMTFGLPEPLVDRAKDLIEFKLKAEDLVKAF